jgi:hypothetical protein
VELVIILERLFDTVFDLIIVDVNFKNWCPQIAQAIVLELLSCCRFA